MKEQAEPFDNILNELRFLHHEKRASYGTDDDPLANYKYAKALGHEPFEATIMRMNEKFLRLQNLYRRKDLLGIREEIRDIIVIGIITMQLIDEVDYGS